MDPPLSSISIRNSPLIWWFPVWVMIFKCCNIWDLLRSHWAGWNDWECFLKVSDHFWAETNPNGRIKTLDYELIHIQVSELNISFRDKQHQVFQMNRFSHLFTLTITAAARHQFYKWYQNYNNTKAVVKKTYTDDLDIVLCLFRLFTIFIVFFDSLQKCSIMLWTLTNPRPRLSWHL